jgi:hypothetical protein
MRYNTNNSFFSAPLGSKLHLSLEFTAAFGISGCDIRSHITRSAVHQLGTLTLSAQPDSPPRRSVAAQVHQA